MDLLYLIVIIIIAGIICIFIASAIIDSLGRKVEPVPVPDPGDLQATRIDAFRSYTYLFATGREVFFPPAPHEKAVYEITVEGLLYSEEGEFSDLFYRTDSSGNFTYGVDWLRVNGSSFSHTTHEPVASDRLKHRYTFRIDQPYERLTLALSRNKKWEGSFKAHVAVLSVGTPSIAETREANLVRVKAKQEEDDVSAKFATQIKTLCVRSQAFRNWADPDYRKKFAEAHPDELIRSQAEIREEAITFLSQDCIVGYLRRHHADVVERFLGRLEALLLAERIVLDKRIGAAALPPPPPRKKLTVEEVRAMKVRKQQVAIGDKVALKLDKIETRLNIRERLEQMPLDQDEREMLEEELIGEIEEGDENHENARTI